MKQQGQNKQTELNMNVTKNKVLTMHFFLNLFVKSLKMSATYTTINYRNECNLFCCRWPLRQFVVFFVEQIFFYKK